jgi:hypothetical protein
MTNLMLTRKERSSAIIAMLLGDGSLWKHPTSSKYCLSIAHSAKQEELIQMKQSILQSIFHHPLRIYKETAKCKGKEYPSLRIRTRGHRLFNVLRKKIYINGKRTVTRDMLDRLTPLGLAIWYMDDGSHHETLRDNGTIRQRNIHLSLCAYTPDEVQMIRDYFLERWGIKWQLMYVRKKYPVLRAGAIEGAKLCEIIAPFVLPSMRYKLLREYQVEQRDAS